ncbi:hypothetical protein B0H17DRAFT_1194589 [Mycena rosella]|uniref:Uncharacterized protein n=1 Tax=Mycena rosella TaxID=1033263 RepID=A0AAD7DZV5_MYCRO|nr:hypothetical protein B0H17DRAFT_1194589 [Mycena rosella]
MKLLPLTALTFALASAAPVTRRAVLPETLGLFTRDLLQTFEAVSPEKQKQFVEKHCDDITPEKLSKIAKEADVAATLNDHGVTTYRVIADPVICRSSSFTYSYAWAKRGHPQQFRHRTSARPSAMSAISRLPLSAPAFRSATATLRSSIFQYRPPPHVGNIYKAKGPRYVTEARGMIDFKR